MQQFSSTSITTLPESKRGVISYRLSQTATHWPPGTQSVLSGIFPSKRASGIEAD